MEKCEHGLEMLTKNQTCYYEKPFGHVVEWWTDMPLEKGYKIFPPVTNSPESAPAVHVTNSDSKEPALTIGAASTGIVGILYLIDAMAPGLISNNVMEWIVFVITLFGPIILAAIIRRKVFSPATVLEALNEGIEATNKAARNRRTH